MRFVVCGEALIDLVPGAATRDTRASSWHALSAGGPMNSAIALARLGRPVEFLGRLGGDAFADQLRRHLDASGVGTRLAVATDEATSLAVVSLDDAGHASYAFHFAGTSNFGWAPDELPALGEGDWLHVASLVTVVRPGHAAVLDWVRAGTGPCSLDVNVRPGVQPDMAAYWADIEPWLAAVGARGGLVKGSDEDFAHLADASGLPADPDALCAALRERYGVRWAVVTLGPDGAVGAGPDGVASVPGRRVDVVDTIGAGDTFLAGLLDALVGAGAPLADALRRGIVASALVCEREGADPPTADEVDGVLAEG